uniref:Uncharacterized protein n=1 Tax=Arundo donax TaxID=35708 RepID=A0A0A8Z7U3_ARUDO
MDTNGDMHVRTCFYLAPPWRTAPSLPASMRYLSFLVSMVQSYPSAAAIRRCTPLATSVLAAAFPSLAGGAVCTLSRNSTV